MSKYLEKSQLPHFWQKIKDYVADHSNGGIEYPNFRYSTNEQWTGDYWLDGKKIYCKSINVGAMPNTTTKKVAHGITNIDHIVNYNAMAMASSNGNTMSIPYVNFYTPYNSITFYVTKTDIELHTGGNNSAYNYCYVTVYYTKTTDTPVQNVVNPTIDLLYPIGSQIYNSKKDFDPNIIYAGTTWKRIKGYVLAGIDESDSDSNIKTSFNQASGKTIGSKWLQQHRHPWDGVNDGASSSSAPGNYPFRIFQDRNVNWNGSAGSMHYTGDGDAQNIQPTQLTYIWERTA